MSGARGQYATLTSKGKLLLLAACWCGDANDLVPQADVLAGRTWCCKKAKCRQLGEQVGADRVARRALP